MQEDAEGPEDQVRELEDTGFVRIGFGDLRRLVFGIDFRKRREANQESQD